MKLGAEDKKKVGALAVLGVMLAGAVYYSFFSGPSATSTPPAAPAPRDRAEAEMPPVPGSEPVPARASRGPQRAQEFHPVLRSKRKEDRVDPFTVDPTIKTYILAKLQDVAAAGSGRNLFQFGPPPSKGLPAGPETIVAVKPFWGTKEIPPPPPPPGPPPPPPLVPFGAKYYGLATSDLNGRKRAFFLDGDEIIIKAEGETVKGHFRVVRIGATSVVVEDTDSKRQQTVQIAEDAQG